jgi:tryptophan synthase beta chain
MTAQTRFTLTEKDIPESWLNIQPFLPRPLPPVLHPGTKQPVGPDDLSPLFPMEIIKQEVSQEPEIEIPEEVRDIYKLWRPTPLIRARRLEKALDTPAHIYYKYEGVSPSGSHKLNTAVAQAYYAKQEGVAGFTTETGAGQWGTALGIACAMFGMECHVYMVRISFDQKPYRAIVMKSYGATVRPSPSDQTQAGRSILEQDPDSPGSLGIAISEAVEAAVTSGGKYKYGLGSVLNHVLMHQTVIGKEALKQMELAGEYPDMVIGCVGGGSNFGGIALPFVKANLTEGKKTRLIAVEPTSCPTFTKGLYAYDFGDTAHLAPLVKMFTLGHTFVPPKIHAGGLRYHGMASILSALYDQGLIEAQAVPQNEIFESALLFAKTEGIIPAPEANHAVRVAIKEALKCKESGEKKVILVNVSGHGNFDLTAYQAYLNNSLENYEYPKAKIEAAMATLPEVGSSD